MRYCYFEIYNYNAGAWTSYKPLVLASTYLYDRCPQPGSPDVTIAQGATTGYGSISELYKPVCDALQMNPFAYTPVLVSTPGLSSELLLEEITGFTGTYENSSFAYGFVYPKQWVEENIVGYLGLSDDSGVRGTTGLAGYNIFNPFFGSLMNPYRELADNDGILYTFVVHPEAAIEDGVFTFARHFRHEGRIRECRVKLYIYKANDKYYWYINLSNYTYSSTETTFWERFEGYEIEHVYNPANPYDDKQKDGDEGGNGGFDHDSDPTPIPDLPAVDITANGGIKLYKCTNTDIAALISYLNSNSPGDAVLKMWQNPIQAVLACYYLPYPVTAAGSATITALGLSTGVAAYTAKQWQQWNLGSVFVDYSCGNCFLDFEPYSTCQIYLPFIGIRRMNMDEVVGKTVGVTYQFDNTSGACVAYITVGGSVKYSFSGSCAVGIPLTQENWGQFYMAAATSAAGALAGGIGGAIGAAAQGAGKLGTLGAAAQGAVEGGGGLSSLMAKPTVSRSGSICGAASALGYPAPYLIIEYPDKAKVANPAPVTGLTCGRTLSLGSLSGYNVIEHVHLHGIAATGPELEEIERLLYEGVVF